MPIINEELNYSSLTSHSQFTGLRNHEESRGLRRPSEDYYIGLHKDLKNVINEFENKIQALPNTGSDLFNQLKDIIDDYGSQVFDMGISIIKNEDKKVNQNTQDDRPLYWARIKMSVILKTHNFLSDLTLQTSKDLIKILEQKSRNYTGMNFAKANNYAKDNPNKIVKKYILTCFDPFGFKNSNSNSNSNLSAIIALSLHGEKILDNSKNACFIQAVIFPIRYKDFDEGVIEETLEKYIISENDRVDMIISTSVKSGLVNFIDRFATIKRGNRNIWFIDNNNKEVDDNSDCLELKPNESEFKWLQTTLPKNLINSGIFYNDFQLRQNFQKGIISSKNDDLNFSSSTDLAKRNAINLLKKGDGMYKASGNNFLSNEVFYRIGLMRERFLREDSSISFFSSGHIHLTMDTFDTTKKTVSTTIKKSLSRSLTAQDYFDNSL